MMTASLNGLGAMNKNKRTPTEASTYSSVTPSSTSSLSSTDLSQTGLTPPLTDSRSGSPTTYESSESSESSEDSERSERSESLSVAPSQLVESLSVMADVKELSRETEKKLNEDAVRHGVEIEVKRLVNPVDKEVQTGYETPKVKVETQSAVSMS